MRDRLDETTTRFGAEVAEMKATNFLRQAWADIDRKSAQMAEFGNPAHSEYRDIVKRFLTFAPTTVKFSLPPNAVFLTGQNGSSVRASEIKLPFQRVILEFETDIFKAIVFAEMLDTGLSVSMFTKLRLDWRLLPYQCVIETDGVTEIPNIHSAILPSTFDEITDRYTGDMQEFGSWMSRYVMRFIEALSCSNVHAEALPARPMNKSMKRRGVLPFDEYHILKIEPRTETGEVRSGSESQRRGMREHLRRGCICQNKAGTRWWRQSSVVNPGAAGKITKDYVIGAP